MGFFLHQIKKTIILQRTWLISSSPEGRIASEKGGQLEDPREWPEVRCEV